ncbi:peptidoglycan-binding domain-containing protein [Dactylosporangium sp. NPDC051485]|uniref:peptidoglycan-binding domain-containing protein n=1 Tax=Dactylosporangium sp. NPDC051485 TaxID=3154846 RepID=UPI00342336A0
MWRRLRLTWIIGAAVLTVAGLAGGWALRTLLGPAPAVLDSPSYTLVSASSGTVEQAIRLNASARWSPTATLANGASGIITTITLKAGTAVESGSTLYTVDLRPAVVAAGSVPAFRELHQGDEGADVAQLQRMLTKMGYPNGTADGKFDDAVAGAVRAWQKSRKLTPDGVVRLGDVIFVPQLPARLALDAKVTVGTRLSGGEPAVQVLPDAPQFTIDLPENQARLINAGMAVDIDGVGSRWQAKVADITSGDQGAKTAHLTAAGADTICASQCASIKTDGVTLLPSRIWLIAPTSGVVVPTVALVTDASGRTGVVLESGVFRPVTVVANGSGSAVVDGIAAGDVVRAPGNLQPGSHD